MHPSIKSPLRTADAGDWSNPYSEWEALNKATRGAFADLRDVMIGVDGAPDS